MASGNTVQANGNGQVWLGCY